MIVNSKFLKLKNIMNLTKTAYYYYNLIVRNYSFIDKKIKKIIQNSGKLKQIQTCNGW